MDIERLYEIYLRHPAVTTDSRKVPARSLFFALHGESFDGNSFAAAALAQGAAYAVVDEPAVVPVGGEARYIVVDDALDTLQKLAAHHRRKLGIRVLAITGTNGKTTTKELAAAVLSYKYKVYFTQGNLNNHIGVPLTLLSIPTETEVAVIEMGASAKGEIAALCEIAAPDYGIVTNIGKAHLEGFGGPEGVREAKGELYDYLCRNGGTAIIRTGDETLESMAAQRAALKKVFYDTSLADGLKSNLEGEYNLYNIAAAIKVGEIFGVSPDDTAKAVARCLPSGDRSRLVETGRNVAIADCYNANPSSMAAALGSFIKANAPAGRDGKPMRKAAILGDMLELGEWGLEEHTKIIRLSAEGRISEVFLVGDNFKEAWNALTVADAGYGKKAGRGDVKLFANVSDLCGYLSENPVANCYILIKGSRGVALERSISLL